MKKRFLTLLSLVMALVMCFALVACAGDESGLPGANGGGNNGGGNDGTSVVVTAEEAAAQLDRLISDGYSGVITFAADTKKTDGIEFTADVKKLGEKVKLTFGDEWYIVDVNTGYLYGETDSVYAMQVIPTGAIDYAIGFIDENGINFDLASVMPTYDKTTKSMVYAIDFAPTVNDLLEPLYSAYALGKSVKALLNTYMLQLTGGLLDFENILTLVDTLLVEYKDYELSDILDELALLPVDGINELIASIPEEVLERCDGRKIGEMVIGLYDYIEAMLSGVMTLDDVEVTETPSVSDMLGGMVEGLLYALLDSPADMADFDEKHEQLTSLIDVALSYNVRDLVNNLTEESSAVRAFISNGITFKKIGGELTLKFDDDKTLKNIGLALEFSHKYSGPAIAGLELFSDNNYTVTVDFAVDFTAPSADEFVIDFDGATDGIDVVVAEVNAVINVNASSPCEIYVETYGNEIDTVSVTAELRLPDGETTEIEATYNKQTGVLTVPAQSGVAVGTVAHIELTLTSGDLEYRVYATVVYLDYDVDNLAALLQGLFGGMGKEPDIDFSPAE